MYRYVHTHTWCVCTHIHLMCMHPNVHAPHIMRMRERHVMCIHSVYLYTHTHMQVMCMYTDTPYVYVHMCMCMHLMCMYTCVYIRITCMCVCVYRCVCTQTHLTYMHLNVYAPHIMCMHDRESVLGREYGVATCSRFLQIIGLFCKRALWKRWYSAKETYNFKERTNRSHPIVGYTFRVPNRTTTWSLYAQSYEQSSWYWVCIAAHTMCIAAHTMCTHDVCLHICIHIWCVDITCIYTLYLHTVSTHCIYTLYVHILCIYTLGCTRVREWVLSVYCTTQCIALQSVLHYTVYCTTHCIALQCIALQIMRMREGTHDVYLHRMCTYNLCTHKVDTHNVDI